MTGVQTCALPICFRHFTAIVAGTSKLEYHGFALYAYSGAVVWVTTFLFIGYHFGEHFKQILALVEENLKVGSLVVGLLILAYLLFRYWKRKKGGQKR